MSPALVHGESLMEYFRALVEDALEHQHLQALELTRYYLVRLLVEHARAERGRTADVRGDEPLALRLARALEAGGIRQRTELRLLGDDALFVSGFFSDSLARRVVDVDYYAALGGYAYQTLSQWEPDTLAPTYHELGQRFLAFADVLTEVSEQSALTSDANLLRLYERWVHSASPRNTERLIRRGIVPVAVAVEGRSKLQ